MTKVLLMGAAMCLVASAAFADYTVSYSWEDGLATILGSYGNVVNDTNVSGPQVGQVAQPGSTFTCPGAFDGNHYLHVSEQPHSGTPQAYLACITGLTEGDVVTASFYGYDVTPAASPSWRIWAHYSLATSCPDCPGDYDGSAGGNDAYTAGTGWDYLEWSWTIPAEKIALVIEGRLYSSPSTDSTAMTDYFADLVSVTVPDNATVTFPDGGPSGTEASTWGGIKALYR